MAPGYDSNSTSDRDNTLIEKIAADPNGTFITDKLPGVNNVNSSAITLLANATFTGVSQDVSAYSNIAVTVFSDVASASDGLVIEFSSDGTNFDNSDTFMIPAATGKTFTVGVSSKFFRVRYINGVVNQTVFRLQTFFHVNRPKPSSHRISDTITGENDAELVKSVSTGQNPNNSFSDIRTQGTDSGNSTTTPLVASGIYRGTWFKWQDSYVKLISDMKSDVAGTFFIDFSESVSPINGSDVSIDDSIQTEYNPAVTVLLKRDTPVSSLWVRHRYVNGISAQSVFVIDAAFLVADSGLVQQPLSVLPKTVDRAGSVRNMPAVLNAAGTAYVDLPIGTDGSPKSYISKIADDILIDPCSGWAPTQVLAGITATRLDPSPPSNRRAIQITNEGPGRGAIGSTNLLTFDSASVRMDVGDTKEFGIDENVTVFGISENTGGTQTVLDRSGGASAGTAGTPANSLTSNNVYTTVSAAGQTIDISSFTAGTTNPLVAVKIGIEGNKQASQFETSSVAQIASGLTAGAGMVSSSSLAGGSNQLYVAFITRNSSTGTVTGVTGGGNTFTASSQINITSGNRRIDMWFFYGTFTAGAVTASLSGSTNAHIAVYRITNADPTTPIQASGTTSGTGTAVTGPGLAGTNKGFSLLAVSHVSGSGTAGSGYTENIDLTNGSGGNIDSIYAEDKALTSTATETGACTLASSVAWATIGATILPAPAIDPIMTLSYTLSAVAGATSGAVAISSSSDVATLVDITGDRTWVVANIPNVHVIATCTTLGAAQANIDWVYLELLDSTGNTTRFSISQLTKAVSL